MFVPKKLAAVGAVILPILAPVPSFADPLIVEVQSVYQLTEPVVVQLLASDKNRKKAPLITVTVDQAPTRQLEKPRRDAIVWFKQKLVTDDYLTMFGFDQSAAPYLIAVRLGDVTAACGTKTLYNFKDIRIVATWQGKISDTPLGCTILGTPK